MAVFAAGGSARAQTTAPVPPSVAAPPAYPDSALFSGIEGEVTYRAHVAADGTVTGRHRDVVPAPVTATAFSE